MEYLDRNWNKLKEWDKCFYSEMPYSNYADTIWEIKNINWELKFVWKVTRVYNDILRTYSNNFECFIENNPTEFEYYSKDGNRLRDLIIDNKIKFTPEWMERNANTMNSLFL
jgi:hypothetical protein